MRCLRAITVVESAVGMSRRRSGMEVVKRTVMGRIDGVVLSDEEDDIVVRCVCCESCEVVRS